MFKTVYNYIKMNPFLFAISLQQVVAAAYYFCNYQRSGLNMKLGIIMMGYALCNFVFITLK